MHTGLKIFNMEHYIQIAIEINDSKEVDFISGLLSQFPFHGFEELENNLLAYMLSSLFTDEMESELRTILGNQNKSFEVNMIENQNWNKEWENNFEPVEIEPGICRIYAPFHQHKPGYKHQIVIHPKMAFGTGHHPTTRLMIKAILEYNFVDKDVLDFGTGTGILAIFAIKRGAKHVYATDIDPMAIENARDNAELNHLKEITWTSGELNNLALAEDSFDICLANIHLSVLEDYAVELFKLTKPMGLIFLSGVLSKDQKVLLEIFQKVGFELDRIMEDSGWLCAVMRRFSK
jgi:ribosomal protein L11 methyltransferase